MKTHAEARALAETLVAIGKGSGVNTQAVITAQNWPLGRAIGNANEVIECLEVMKGRGPVDLIELSLDLAERMLLVAGVAGTRADARARCRLALDSGAALEKFRSIIERQGGDARVVDDYGRLPSAPSTANGHGASDGFVTLLDAGLLGRVGGVGRRPRQSGRRHRSGGRDYDQGHRRGCRAAGRRSPWNCVTAIRTAAEALRWSRARWRLPLSRGHAQTDHRGSALSEVFAIGERVIVSGWWWRLG
jgi:hypothetical protein